MAKLEIKLVKSPIGRLEKHKRTVEALGFKKVGQVLVKDGNDSIKGMINAVDFMLEVKEVN